MAVKTKSLNHNYPLYDYAPATENLKTLIYEAQARTPDKLAFRYRRKGEDIDVTYTEFKYEFNSVGTALMSVLGYNGTHSAIIGENSYDYILTHFAVMNTGGVSAPIDRELAPEGIANIINMSDSEYLFCSSAYESKIADILPSIPNIKKIFVFDKAEDDGIFCSFDKLKAEGAKLLDGGDKSFVDFKIDTKKLATLVFTSGTTGVSKGVMLSQSNLLLDAVSAMKNMLIYDCCVSVLPYHHTYEIMVLVCMLHNNTTICINESLRTVLVSLKKYKPLDICLVPLFVETMYKRVWATAEDSGKAGGLRFLLKLSRLLRKCGIDIRHKLFKTIHENFGGRLTKIICGGAPIKTNVAQFFDDIGIQVLLGYGISECSPIVSVNRNEFYDCFSTGVPVDCCTVRIDNPNEDGEGEICVKGDNVMLGYYKNPEATAAVFTEDGYFRTGDIGKLDEHGRLYITGRIKNLIVLNNGKNVYPEELENYFADSEIVSEIIVYADKKQGNIEVAVTAEIYPNPEYIKNNNITDVKAAVQAEVDKINEKLPIYKQIKNVKLRDAEFEKTTSKKIKRNYNK